MSTSVVAAARSGDPAALDVLVRAHHERVYRYGLRTCRDAFDADDAVQEAFIRFARRPDVARDAGVLIRGSLEAVRFAGPAGRRDGRSLARFPLADREGLC